MSSSIFVCSLIIFLPLLKFKLVESTNVAAMPDKIARYPQKIDVPLGDRFKLECPIPYQHPGEYSPIVHYHEWFFNGTKLVNGKKYRMFDEFMVVRRTNESHTGVYTCALNKSRYDFNVSVVPGLNMTLYNGLPFSRPQFTKEQSMVPWEVSLNSGQSARLNCQFVGYPKPEIRWFKNKEPFRRYNGYFSEYLKDGQVLRLENVTPGDSGEYTCIVANIFGSINYTYEVYVKNFYVHTPIFERGKEERMFVKPNTKVTIDCTFDKDFEARWVWYRLWRINETFPNDTTFDGTREWRIRQIMRSEPGMYLDTEVPQLRLWNVTCEQFGFYLCYVENRFGNSTRRIELVNFNRRFTLEANNLISEESDNSYWWSIVSVLLVLIVCAFAYVYYSSTGRPIPIVRADRTYVITKNIIRDESTGIVPQFRIEESKSDKPIPTKYNRIVVTYNVPEDMQWKIPRDRVRMTETVGEGAFGVVYKAKLLDKDVAVKTLKNDHTDDDLIALLQEIEMMKRVGEHENVVRLLGCCVKKAPLLVIMEYVPNGNLKNYLTKLKNYPKQISSKDLINFAVQIAAGMKHLSSKGCVHRDLAARNILVGENNVMKICDFGLARSMSNVGYYRVQNNNLLLPVRWMAPEGLKYGVFTTKSDSWSFGVLVWEILTFAGRPYDAIDDLNNLLVSIEGGLRLEKPENCNENVFSVMSQCWNIDPELRPDFDFIHRQLKNCV